MFLLTERIFKIFLLLLYIFFDRTTIQCSNTKVQPAVQLLVTAVEIGYPTQAWIMGRAPGSSLAIVLSEHLQAIIFNVVYLEPVIILDQVKSLTWVNVIVRKHLICQCGRLLNWDQETLIVYIGPHLQSLPEEEKKHYGSFNGSFTITDTMYRHKITPALIISTKDNLQKGIQGRSRI